MTTTAKLLDQVAAQAKAEGRPLIPVNVPPHGSAEEERAKTLAIARMVIAEHREVLLALARR